MDRGSKNAPSRYRKLRPGDRLEWLIVALLFAVSSIGVYVLTSSLLPALFVGILVWGVAIGVVAML
ncbi:hypothetical protein IT779_19895 [Nocardia sp. NEAU-351]|uniref:Uncharacterized protein n=1 Tax=Nocardia bovistercoris TaxID=2785916 RepID=A0A931IDJ4_9NOCA|nr:hypothetical protein [Nocardia bovistercoris]